MSDQPPYPPPPEDQPPSGYPPPPPPEDQPPGAYPPPPPPPPPPPGAYPPPPPPPPPPGAYPPPPPPPPPGAYPPPPPPPPPPPGGYSPPPPPGGWGQPPPPPPPFGSYPQGGGYTPSYGSTQPFDLGAAFSYGWNKFQQNAGPLIGVMAIVLVGTAVAFGVRFTVLNSTSSLFATLLLGAISQIIYFLIVGGLQIGLYRAALAVTSGRPIAFAELYSSENIGPFLMTIFLYGLLVGVGLILCVIPGIVVAFYGFLAPYYVLDQNQSPVDAVKSSFRTVQANLGAILPFAILAFLVYIAGAIACGIGIVVSAPVALIATAYVYRSLNGEPIAA